MLRTGLLRECWQFRGFIGASVKRDFVSRYLGTQLGWFWAVAQPLAMILIYTLVFAEIMKPALPGHESKFAYSIYLCAGILLWQLFSDLVIRSVGVFVHNGGLLKKVNLPKLALPVIVALSGLSSFAVVAALFLGFLAAIGGFPWPAILAMVPVVVLVVALAMGLGVLLGTINVFYRDVEQSTSMRAPVLVLADADRLSRTRAAGLSLRRCSHGTLCGRSSISRRRSSSTTGFPIGPRSSIPTLVAAVFLVLGLVAFRRLSGEIVDEL